MSAREGALDRSTLEEFIIALARVSTDGRRYLRGLSRADAEDALSKAMAWCWEHRAEFHTGLDTVGAWFATAVKWAALGVRRDTAREKGRRSYLTPEEAQDRAGRLPSYAPRAQSDSSRERRSRIDHDIERLLRRPKHGRADCPSCWKCRYFDGFKPDNWKPPTWIDPEVRAAVEATEREKIRIANEGRIYTRAPRHAEYAKRGTLLNRSGSRTPGWRNKQVRERVLIAPAARTNAERPSSTPMPRLRPGFI